MKMKKQVKQLLADDTSQGTDITGLKTDVGNLKTAVGSSDTSAGSLKKRCKDIETAIGDEDTASSILGRIKALETAANNSGGGDS
jgi:hypothetical protein